MQELILLSWGSKSKDTLHESGERRAPRMCCKFAIYADCFLTLLSPELIGIRCYRQDHDCHEAERTRGKPETIASPPYDSLQPSKKSSKSRQFTRPHACRRKSRPCQKLKTDVQEYYVLLINRTIKPSAVLGLWLTLHLKRDSWHRQQPNPGTST